MREPTFALIGAAGFVAPRHIDAIHNIGGRLVAAMDPRDALGALDRYGEGVDVVLHAREMPPTDYVTLCTPNDLHVSQAHYWLCRDRNVICEKPVALNAEGLDELIEVQRRTGRRVWPILQMRLNPAVLAWRERSRTGARYRVSLDYVTPRGPWYWKSWKGDEAQSGGIATNLGIHLFDLLIWLFGDARESEVTYRDRAENPRAMAGRLELERADVTWSLSTIGSKASRVLTIDGEAIDLSEGFHSLHTAVYREILAGRWYGLADARPAVALCEGLRRPSAVPKTVRSLSAT